MAVIEFDHVSKIYRLGAGRTSLREAVPQLTRKLFNRNGHQQDDQLFWALNDVSYKVEQGEVLGIIGHNGAGKSTMLKLLSKVSFPTSGHIRTQGRMAALIELGAGFHPDLSGRENVYLNGVILGLTKQELDAQFSNIVEFAGLERFIDTPIKRYSSGMYVRLAFAVAAHVRAELLVVDEVLSVGDMAFQQKSLAKMNELRDNGATIVFVSHNLPAIQTFCSRVLLLKAGCVVANGEPAEVIETYKKLEQETRNIALAKLRAQDGELVQSLEEEGVDTSLMTKVELLNAAGQPTQEFAPTERLTVRCHFTIPKEMKYPICAIRVYRRVDGVTCFKVAMDHPSQPALQGEGVFEAHFDELLLVPGAYILEAMIHNDQYVEEGAVGSPKLFYISGRIRGETAGVFYPDAKWSFEQESLVTTPEPLFEG